MTYEQILKDSNREQEQLEYQVQSTKLSLESAILETRTKLSQLQRQQQLEQLKFPVDFGQIVQIQQEVSAYANGLTMLLNIKNEWFPEQQAH